MPSQPRAEATRRRIIRAAIELFKKSGFSATNLNQIIRRAHVTPGAFYYHFASKDEVALAIIDEVALRMDDLRNTFVGTTESGLENVIVMAFQLCALLEQDDAYRVAGYLEHTMVRYTEEGIHDVAERVEMFVSGIAPALRASELRPGTSPKSAARVMVTLIYGCLAMTDLIPNGITTRLAECWRILLPGLVAPESLPHFDNVLSRTVEHFRQLSVLET